MTEADPSLSLWLLAGVAVCSLLLSGWLEHRFSRRDSALRGKLGACRTALEACEAERAQMRRQFNAQAVELARYRGASPSDRRLTRVYTGLPPEPIEDEA
jgi:hypothetical protein